MSAYHQDLIHFPTFSDLSSTIALLLSISPEFGKGIFTNFSLEPTWRWYFQMTPFETIFLGFIILQFAVLNMFAIMPLNLNDLLNGIPDGRRKRDTHEMSKNKNKIGIQLLHLLKKLDPDECTFKSLCELEIQFCCTGNLQEIPIGISSMLSALRKSYKKRKGTFTKEKMYAKMNFTSPDQSFQNQYQEDHGILQLYEEAIEIGDGPSPHQNSNITFSPCRNRYPHCPLETDEIMDFIKTIHILDEV